jgi:hypothetical protein
LHQEWCKTANRTCSKAALGLGLRRSPDRLSTPPSHRAVKRIPQPTDSPSFPTHRHRSSGLQMNARFLLA